jgi:hypothetical protein
MIDTPALRQLGRDYWESYTALTLAKAERLRAGKAFDRACAAESKAEEDLAVLKQKVLDSAVQALREDPGVLAPEERRSVAQGEALRTLGKES